ncbi:hypothetical protein [Cedecea sp. NFIX57]|uniref:hypothetical protein n=1 Tax=Cedecea sp. NFIX57 TaxID=1566286 RepID=UPI000A0A4D4C|nr:hypothetical protein [Cedecea sp. NFIX57]SMG29089.1 hypothetical protein SAMN03159353_1006103 [Cedecea sp. NFIX57]
MSDKNDINATATSSLPDSTGTTYSKEIEILNPEWNVDNKIILTETIDVSAFRLVDFYYNVNINLKILENSPVITGPAILIVDKDGNILRNRNTNMSTPEPGEYSMSLGVKTPSIYRDMDVKVLVAFINRTGNFPDSDFLMPAVMDESVINPVSVHLSTWNRYDYFRLTKSIETKNNI